MSDYVITKTITNSYAPSEEALRNSFENILKRNLRDFKWNIMNSSEFSGGVKTIFLHPLVDVAGEAVFRFSNENKNVDVMIRADAKGNWWFYSGVICSIVILLFLEALSGFLLGVFVTFFWYKQKKEIKDIFERASKELIFNYSQENNTIKDKTPLYTVQSYKYCAKCGTRLSSETVFCFNCGEKQQ